MRKLKITELNRLTPEALVYQQPPSYLQNTPNRQFLPLPKPSYESRHEADKIMGNEVKGVQQCVVDNCDMCIEIPQYGTKHSLNVR